MQDLNPYQKKALNFTNGPMLVLAGAGSGKTRLISHKFSFLVKTRKHYPDSIFAVTFTNKAAEEMRKRINGNIEKKCDDYWIGTFYSLCKKILRKEIKAIGYNNNFSIFDEDDQYNLVRHILKEFKMYEALYKGIISRISNLKSSLIDSEEFLSSGDGFGFDEKLAKIYVRYQDELKRCNALDCDDLIMLTLKLLKSNPRLLKKYQNTFSYILADEFQDINNAQYHLLKLLASAHKKICVAADDDQSIYKFKGAGANNISNFVNDFPDAKVIKLEQSYRFTQNILNVSRAIISKNPGRESKKLWTDKGQGGKVNYCCFNTFKEESKYIAKVIKELYLKGIYNYRDVAVFYRVSLQSKAIEDALRDEGIHYRVFGGISFYQKKEIKDIIAYVRLSLNHKDNVSLRRIINNPQRGISESTLSKIEYNAKKKSMSLFDAMKKATHSDSFTHNVKEKLNEFIKLIEGFSSAKYKAAADMLRSILKKSGYAKTLEGEKSLNIEEIILSAEGQEITDFLDRISLCTSLDEITKGDYVSLMTLHCAKGLEFPVVFITGLEEGLLPYCKAINNEDEIFEERKLFYVGMTRSRDVLWLTSAKKRRLYTKVQLSEPSRFLKDIPRNCCRWIEKISDHPTFKHLSVIRSIEPKNDFLSYSTGCRVKHPMWGVGVVRDCYGNVDDLRVMVNFPNFGIKKLAVKFANLEKI
jgi:DNA helicase-2/ATP-dependent DNA helicase PcrA